eukprot:CAMPEP_0172321922 /NCGR_PEP_ID=MMETSP1058-20130122/44664_1 /TAXON_ID=83371 /ORGANISM="Detonula confervacea, Strain CCMP 353" /LENGTH=588 /DNA_ID=CAMNT_0013037547 /DNA_START=457 /DNA_END=2223 /DNA_ORIENTATION=-
MTDDDDTAFFTKTDDTAFSTEYASHAPSSGSSQSAASHDRLYFNMFAFDHQTRLKSQSDSLNKLTDGKLRDDEGNIVERLEFGVGADGQIEQCWSECGQEVELESVYEQKVFSPEVSGKAVELVPNSKRNNRMTVQIEGRKKKPSSVSGEPSVSTAASAASGFTTAFSSGANRTRSTRSTPVRGNLKGASAMSTKPFFGAAGKKAHTRAGTAITSSLSSPKSRGFFKKKSKQTKPEGSLHSPEYSKRPHALSPRRVQNKSDARKLGDTSSRGYIASRKMNSSRRRETPDPHRELVPRTESPDLQLNSSEEGSYDDETFASPCFTSDQSVAATEQQSCDASYDEKRLLGPKYKADISPVSSANDANAETSPPIGASMARDPDDKRNVVEKAADLTYEAVKLCWADTVGNSFDENTLVEEKDEKDRTALEANLGDLEALGEAIMNRGVEMDVAGLLMPHDDVWCGGEGIISVSSKESSTGTEPSYISNKGRERERVIINTSLEDQPVKSSKRFSLRLPTSPFSRKRKEEGILNEDMFMAGILNEIKLEQDKQTKTKSISADHYDLPQGFSDLIANTIAEEAVLSCLDAEI